ncbi:hypothetical protein [Aestuariispira insulae]|uniref:Secreted protein n=1 Tax=Aestuariispira insulae TaxID=1461337 RepID=A0A3D9HN89_9PROT|nr:hypothetical protein [Aestuariispira insulae]RED50939.1 hypothetical protein DFP90_104211 [Aestuariispira insulae]
MKHFFLVFTLSVGWLCPVQAGQVIIEQVTTTAGGDGRIDFHVTLRHGDTGWDHYANKWEVLAPDGTILGTRVLYHPHVNEQPFTRSLIGVSVPDGIGVVRIRAFDSRHGSSPDLFEVHLD